MPKGAAVGTQLERSREVVRAFEKKVEKVSAKLKTAKDLLWELEWAGRYDTEEEGVSRVCPICGESEGDGHKPSCRLHRFLEEP